MKFADHLLCATTLFCLAGAAAARTVELQSPDQRNVITLSVEGGAAAYTVLRDGRQVIAKSPLGILLQR
ncbi:MAG TPA: glycoside hydrolase family 97 N-terminal domain-containing protein, partial [Sphingomicrobium sp.]|nr:glycoside hydrolase family 97 N-terminal domain-containing protein [Sphingomicrobium sp.]